MLAVKAKPTATYPKTNTQLHMYVQTTWNGPLYHINSPQSKEAYFCALPQFPH